MAGYEYDQLTERVIGCAYSMHNVLGAGFFEKVYENSRVIELREQGIPTRQQAPITIHYRGEVVGEYVADVLVEDRLVLELKAGLSLRKAHEVQRVNYLSATGKDVGLLINFGKSVQVKRKYREHRKQR